jgi:hypothetical protein
MMYFFIGIATQSLYEPKMGPDAEKQAQDLVLEIMGFLPCLAAVASGRIERMLVELKQLVQNDEVSSYARDIQLIIDMLCLLGVDSSLYNKLFKDAEKDSDSLFLGELLERLLSGPLHQQKPDEDLKLMATKLLELLVGVSVGASPENIQVRQRHLWRILEAYLQKLLIKHGDEKLVSAGCLLLHTTCIISMQVLEEEVSVNSVKNRLTSAGQSLPTEAKVYTGILEFSGGADLAKKKKDLENSVKKALASELAVSDNCLSATLLDSETTTGGAVVFDKENNGLKSIRRSSSPRDSGQIAVAFTAVISPHKVGTADEKMSQIEEDPAGMAITLGKALGKDSVRAEVEVTRFQAYGSDIAMFILSASLDLLLPFMPTEMREPLLAVLKITSTLSEIASNPGKSSFARHAPALIENMAIALCVPSHTVKGIVALSQGDWGAAVDLCKPFCQLNPEILHQISQVLPAVQKTVVDSTDNFAEAEEVLGASQVNSHSAARIKQIAASAMQDQGSAKDLFELVDLDKNGCISMEEFQILMNRLGFRLNSHRLVEIMSTCKKKMPAKENSVGRIGAEIESIQGLDQEEFTQALAYVQSLVTVNSLQCLNISWSWLMVLLIRFTIILLAVIVVIILGLSAFVSGGIFNSIINSVLTIATGIGGFQIFKPGGSAASQDSAEATESKKNLITEVKDTVLGRD